MQLIGVIVAVLCCTAAMANTVKRDIVDRGLNTVNEKPVPQVNDDVHTSVEKRTLPREMQYLAVGYHYLRGNPDGGMQHNGGVDPGILITRRHLKLTDVADPPEVESGVRSSCTSSQSTQVYYGTQSYQNKFSLESAVSVSGSYGLASFAFSLSGRYEEAQDTTLTNKNIVKDNTEVCNFGTIRYKDALAGVNNFDIDDEFAVAVCALPTSYSADNQQVFMEFFERWGTHTTMQITLGTRSVDRSKSTLEEVFRYAMTNAATSVTASGDYGGASGSLSLSMDSLRSQSSFDSTELTELYSLSLGTEASPEPIGYRISAIPETLDSKFWQNLDDYVSQGFCPQGATYAGTIQLIKNSMGTALENFPAYVSAQASQDQLLQVPIVWPIGTYTLPKPNSGCPNPSGNWASGYRFHDTEDDDSNNWWSGDEILDADLSSNNLAWRFCSKTQAVMGSETLDWMPGKYCIMKKGGSCPSGFQEGSLKWDDEDDDNINRFSGVLPEGQYTHDTVIYFCCRSDGFTPNEIYLPMDKPFVLLKQDSNCQNVFGMSFQVQIIRWDDEDDNNISTKLGSHPYDTGGADDHVLHFCYYTKV